MKATTFAVILTIITSVLFAQDFTVPANYKLDRAEDYGAYEQEIINCFNWLMKTPLNEQTVKRKEASEFLFKWLSGSPEVHVLLHPEIFTFIESPHSPDLLIIFLGGWANYSIQTRDLDNKVAGNLAGIESVIDFYSRNKSTIGKEKNVEKYIKMKKKGKLKEHIEKYA
jgi:hypothetical protein